MRYIEYQTEEKVKELNGIANKILDSLENHSYETIEAISQLMVKNLKSRATIKKT